MYAAFVIIIISLLAALLTEGASWYLIYRKEDYQRLKKTIESLQSKGMPAAATQNTMRDIALTTSLNQCCTSPAVL